MIEILLDSRLSTNGSWSNPEWYFREPIDIKRFKIKNFNMMNTILPIDIHNNKIVITRDEETKTIIIPPGKYSASDISGELDTQFRTAFGPEIGPTNMSSSYDTKTFKFNIKDNIGTKPFIIHGPDSTSQSWLGNSTENSTSSSTFTSPNLADLSGMSSFVLVSSSLRSESVYLIGKEEINTLGRVNISESVGSVINEDDLTGWIDAPQRLYNLNLILLNELDYRQVSLGNGGSFRVRIQLE